MLQFQQFALKVGLVYGVRFEKCKFTLTKTNLPKSVIFVLLIVADLILRKCLV